MPNVSFTNITLLLLAVAVDVTLLVCIGLAVLGESGSTADAHVVRLQGREGVEAGRLQDREVVKQVEDSVVGVTDL